ncbi:MAG: PilZ domain-containing protein [Nitrospirota bacterium]|nr:PilZ domain-containing protein [Nitrospirota bacterium]
MRVRRKHERFVRRLESEFVGEGKNYRAISSDFSRYGLFIRTNHAFVPGTELNIIVHLPTGNDCRLTGVVRRAMKTPIVSLKNGMGIELLSRDHNYIKFLKEFDPGEDGEPGTYQGEKSAHPQPPHQGQHNPHDHYRKHSSDPAPDFIIIACTQCGVKNKVSRARLSHTPKCGKCGSPISLQA